MLPHRLNKTYRVVFDEKQKQERRREKDAEDPRSAAVAYVDTARLVTNSDRCKSKDRGLIDIYLCLRNISVVLESGDLSADLEAEGLGEQEDPTAPSAKVGTALEKYDVMYVIFCRLFIK